MKMGCPFGGGQLLAVRKKMKPVGKTERSANTDRPRIFNGHD